MMNLRECLIWMNIKDQWNYVESLTNHEGVASFIVLNNHTYTFTPYKTDYLGAPLDVIFTKENQNSLKEVKLFMSTPSKIPHLIEAMISSPTLRANKDYELMVFTCSNEPTEKNPNKWAEHKTSS